MSLQTCWKCLARASDHVLSPTTVTRLPIRIAHAAPIAAFTTSASLSANPVKKKATPSKSAGPVRGQKVTFTKKKKRPPIVERSRKPAVGERKALRKRIVLSNTNALEVPGMQDLSAESMMDERLRGQVLGIPGTLVDQLRAVEAFKVTQGWPLFRRPAMLIRKETLELGRMMDGVSQDGSQQTVRRVIVGERGSGKTLMLLQAMTMAMLKNWVVINIPQAQDLIIGHTEYQPLPSTAGPTLFAQPTYTANLLLAIARANPILETLALSSPPSSFSIPLPPSITLARLAHLGAQEPETAWPIFQLLLSELTKPGLPPLLLCLDGLAHTMCPTRYLSGTTYKPIHAHDLALIAWFHAHLSGTAPLPNGGAVLAATSESNNPVVPSLALALTQLEGKADVERDPYKIYDERVLGVFQTKTKQIGNVDVQRLGGVSRQEARGLMEYWALSGVLRQRVDEAFVAEKWVFSGGGVVGELERGCVRMRV